MSNKVHYTLNKVLSYVWAWLIILIGARRRGKTYSVKKWLLNGWVYHKEQFVIWRDTEAECEILCKDNGLEFWGDIIDKEKKFKNLKIEMAHNTIKINNEIAGFILPTSSYRKFKGSQYEKVKRGLYDEFIREKGARYNGDRASAFLNMLLTVASYRKDFKMIMTANALDKGDTILSDILEISIKNNEFGLYFNRKKGVILDYIPNSEAFIQYQKNGNAYKLIAGTRFADNLIDNNFIDNVDGLFYTNKKPSDLIGIYYNRDDVAVRIYESRDGETFYAGIDTNPNSCNYMRQTFNIKQVNNKISLADNKEKKFLQEIFKNNLIKFENKYILNIFKEIIE